MRMIKEGRKRTRSGDSPLFRNAAAGGALVRLFRCRPPHVQPNSILWSVTCLQRDDVMSERKLREGNSLRAKRKWTQTWLRGTYCDVRINTY